MKGLPKSIIAKYGISKKAWDIYRGKKKKGKKRGISMAKKKKSGKKKGFGGSGVANELIGSGLVVGYDMYLSPMLPVSGLTKDIVDFSIGYMLKGKGGMIGSGARALRTVAAYRGVARLMQGQATTAPSNSVQIVG